MANNIPVGQRLKMASKELAMGNIGNAYLSISNPGYAMALNPSNYGSGMPNASGTFFFENGTGREIWFSYSNTASCIQAYTKCPPIAAIVNKKATAHLRGRQSVVNTQGKAKGKEATGEYATKLKALLKRPNYRQTWNEFEAQIKIYQQVFGYCLLFPIVPVGFPIIDAKSIWVIPPNICEVVERNKFFLSEGESPFERITLTYGGERANLPLDAVYAIKDISASFISLTLTDSRIRVLEQNINNVIGELNARGSMIDDRGALGVISSEKTDDSGKIPMTPKEKLELQDEFKKYGIKKGQFKYIITTAAMKWTNVGYSTKELMLFEEEDANIMRMCDTYGVPFRLMASERNNSLGGSDAAEFNKQFYEDTIIPESDSLYDQLNNMFETELYGIKLYNDFSHLAVLQADAVKTAQASMMLSRGLQMDFLCDVITKNEWRIAKGWDPIDGGDVYYSEIKDLIGAPVIHAGQMGEQQTGTTADANAGKDIQNLLA